MARLAHAFQIVGVKEQLEVSLVRFLVVDHGSARRLAPFDNERLALLALILVAPDDGEAEVKPRLALV